MSRKAKRSRAARRNRSARDGQGADNHQGDLLVGLDGSPTLDPDAEAAPGPDRDAGRTRDEAGAPPEAGDVTADAADGPADRAEAADGEAERPVAANRVAAPPPEKTRRTAEVVAPPADSAPRAPRPHGNELARARDLVEVGRVEEAMSQYRAILAENPASLKAHHNLGVLFDELGRHEDAIEHFEQALRLQPDNVDVLTNHASALTALGRFEAADELLRKALRIAPEDLPARLAFGVLAFRRGLYGQAEVELRWVCERDSANGAAFYYRAEALNRISRFEESEPLMKRAAELLPNDPRPFYTLGHLYDRQERPADAAEMYRRARDLQSP